MTKGHRRAAQASEEQQHQPKMVEGEPQVDIGKEEMDVETMKNVMAGMQVELATLRANKETVVETIVLL